MKQAIDFLIDISDKMDKKLSVTQRVLTDEIIPNISEEAEFGMRTFLSVAKCPIIINSLDMGKNTKGDFIKKATSLPYPNGGTPIAEVISTSIDEIQKSKADRKIIFLIGAGEETEGVYEMEVDRKKSDVQINIIGIGMRDTDLATAQKVAQSTGGICCNIPSDKFSDAHAIHEIVIPAIDVLKGKVIVPQGKNEVLKQQEEPQRHQAIERKPEETSSIPKMAAFVSVPNAGTKPMQKDEPRAFKGNPANISAKNFNETAQSIHAAKTESAPQTNFDALAEIKQTNESIQSLLNEHVATLQKVLQNNENQRKENTALREAEERNISSIQTLKAELEEAGDTISQLKEVVRNREEEIEALNSNKQDLLVTINQWEERDRKVIVDLDPKEREAVSRASEELLFDFLNKKYPNRVKWCNQDSKQSNGYDFKIEDYENNDTEYFIACKGAKDDTKTFFLSQKEWELCLKNNLNYQVYLVRNIASKPKIILIDNLIGWLMSGKVLPGALKNEKVKAGQVMLTLAK